ncbi:MAG: hypothetical protein NWF13_04305 [Candidatus Bathyarchaeota archaeon]|nr:hypothetical protein [Candidatus Bathyarchaeota archaeon]
MEKSVYERASCYVASFSPAEDGRGRNVGGGLLPFTLTCEREEGGFS